MKAKINSLCEEQRLKGATGKSSSYSLGEGPRGRNGVLRTES